MAGGWPQDKAANLSGAAEWRDSLPELQRESLTYDSLAIAFSDLDHTTGLKSFDTFTIHMHSDYTIWRIDIDRLQQTLNGWKCAGEITLQRVNGEIDESE